MRSAQFPHVAIEPYLSVTASWQAVLKVTCTKGTLGNTRSKILGVTKVAFQRYLQECYATLRSDKLRHSLAAPM